jgi:high-affinity nickel-transport protein
MSLVYTSDGVLMVKACDWAFINPLRKIFYNVVVTGLSATVALLIGTVELLQLLTALLHLHGALFGRIEGLDFSVLGFALVAFFALAWAASVAVWKWGRFEERHYPGGSPSS